MKLIDENMMPLSRRGEGGEPNLRLEGGSRAYEDLCFLFVRNDCSSHSTILENIRSL